MASPKRLTVRAQRKYAHKIFIPAVPAKSDAAPGQEQTPRPQPLLIKYRKPIGDIINDMAFKSLHDHVEEQIKQILADSNKPRVLLKRYTPSDNPNIPDETPNNPGDDVNILEPPAAKKRTIALQSPSVNEDQNNTNSKKNRPYNTRSASLSPVRDMVNDVDKSRSHKSLSSTSTSTVKNLGKEQKTTVKPKKKPPTPKEGSLKPPTPKEGSLKPPTPKEGSLKLPTPKEVPKRTKAKKITDDSSSTSQNLESLKPVESRYPRVLTRARVKLAAAQEKIDVPQRRVSSSSTEDNQPLTYLIKEKLAPCVLDESPTIPKVTRKRTRAGTQPKTKNSKRVKQTPKNNNTNPVLAPAAAPSPASTDHINNLSPIIEDSTGNVEFMNKRRLTDKAIFTADTMVEREYCEFIPENMENEVESPSPQRYVSPCQFNTETLLSEHYQPYHEETYEVVEIIETMGTNERMNEYDKDEMNESDRAERNECNKDETSKCDQDESDESFTLKLSITCDSEHNTLEVDSIGKEQNTAEDTPNLILCELEDPIEIDDSDIAMDPTDLTQSFTGNRVPEPNLPEPLPAQMSSENNVPESDQAQAQMSSENNVPESDQAQVDDKTKKKQDQIKSFSEFVIRMFNASNYEVDQSDTDTADCGDESVVARVNDWLVRNSAQNSSEFKVPNPRARRGVAGRASSVASSTRSSVAYMTAREICLRNNCPSWNYLMFYKVNTEKDLVRRFCGVCTRCVVIFKTELIQRSASNVVPQSLPNQSVDVYEFTAGADDEPCTPLIRESCFQIFNIISLQEKHADKLREAMTIHGQKIFDAATIIHEKIQKQINLQSKDYQTLAHVIGVLSKCNRARMQGTRPLDSRITPARESDASFILMPRHSVRLRSVAPRLLPSLALNPPPSPVPNPPPSPALNSPPSPAPQSLSPSSIVADTCAMRNSLRICPTDNEFRHVSHSKNPIEFAKNMRRLHPNLSFCGIKPPPSFKPTCINIDLEGVTFKTTNHYVHRMLIRWGPATKQLTAIRNLHHPKIQRSPLFDGLEVDLVKLFFTVQSEGGIEACQNNSEKWKTIARKMNLHYQGRVNTKLENLYLKYLLGYNTLTHEEREKLYDDVETTWSQRAIRCLIRAKEPLWRQDRMVKGLGLEDDDDEADSHLEKVCAEAEECIAPGRIMSYACYKKLGEKINSTYFPGNTEPKLEEVEREYWEIVMAAESHVCVHAASVDSSEHDYGFSDEPTDPYWDHPWNLKRLHTVPSNLLSHLGPTLGVTSTSIYHGMMFSTSCWHMDPISVPWIEYLHSGPPKIWYSISSEQQEKFREAAEALCSFAVQDKSVWLSSDIIMIPPSLLEQYGVQVERHVQYAGEFVIVYPNTYCASICTGLTVSEGVYFAPHSWILNAERIYDSLRDSCEPSLFSIEKLLIAMAESERVTIPLLQRVHSSLNWFLCAELKNRKALADSKIPLMTREEFLAKNRRANRCAWQIQPHGECSYCRCQLHFSRVIGIPEPNNVLCSYHASTLLEKANARGLQAADVYCIVLYTNKEIYRMSDLVKQRVVDAIREQQSINCF